MIFSRKKNLRNISIYENRLIFIQFDERKTASFLTFSQQKSLKYFHLCWHKCKNKIDIPVSFIKTKLTWVGRGEKVGGWLVGGGFSKR